MQPMGRHYQEEITSEDRSEKRKAKRKQGEEGEDEEEKEGKDGKKYRDKYQVARLQMGPNCSVCGG